jgi:3-methyladenine DNA glycosylase/8-oxoguanine DNA glycosylase
MSVFARSEIRLKGPSGEPVDFARTIVSHGVAELPPNELDLDARKLVTTLAVPGGARTVRLSSTDHIIGIELVSGRAGERQAEVIRNTVRHMFRLDEDLSEFYAIVRDDPELSWCALGAGRMLRAPTVFEDVVNTT